MKTMHSRDTQSGNALLIVLIGIALFAALMFSFTRNNRSADMGSIENAAILAQQIASYGDKIHGAVQNIMLQNGCLDTQISFENSTVSGYTNGSLDKCKIFDPAGGGINFDTPPEQAVDTAAATAAGSSLAGNYLFYGKACIAGVGTDSTTCVDSEAELLFIMPFVTEAVCEQLDQIALRTTAIPLDGINSFNTIKFAGTYVGQYVIDVGSAAQSACFQTAGNPGAGYHYYQVLVTR